MPQRAPVVAGKVMPDFSARAEDMAYFEADDFDMDPAIPAGFEVIEIGEEEGSE